MCVVSMVGDHYHDKWKEYIPMPWDPGDSRRPARGGGVVIPTINVSREEFYRLKRDVEVMKALLKRAKEYDERNGEPDCEIDEKMATLRKVAELVGVNLDDVIGKEK